MPRFVLRLSEVDEFLLVLWFRETGTGNILFWGFAPSPPLLLYSNAKNKIEIVSRGISQLNIQVTENNMP